MMLKKSCFTLLFIIFLSGGLSAKAAGKFTDAVTGLSFKIPEGWQQAKKQYPPFFYSDPDSKIQDFMILEKYFRDVPVEEAYEKYWEQYKKSYVDIKVLEHKEIELKDRKAILIYFSYQKEKKIKAGEIKKKEEVTPEESVKEESGKPKKMFLLFIKTGSIVNILEFFNLVMTGEDAGKWLEELAGTIKFETAPKVLHSLFSAKENDIEELIEKKEYIKALEAFEKILQESSRDPQLLMHKAVLNACLDKEEEAVKFIKVLMARTKKELASYYEINIPETNVILFTDIRDNAKIKILKESMVTAAKFAKEDLGIKTSEFPIIWIMSESRDVNKALIGTLLGTSSGFEGVFVPAFGIFFSDTYTGYGTFVHEYMHALHSGDQAMVLQDHPRWLTEMLSTTYESLRWNYVSEKIEVKYKSSRLESLKEMFTEGKHVGLEKIITKEKGWNKDVDIEIFYATVRYLGIYLYSENLLGDFYKEYKKSYKNDKSGLKAFEKVTGKKISEFEKEWEKWLPTLVGKE